LKWDPFVSVDAFVAIDEDVGVPAPRDPKHFSTMSFSHRSPHCDFTHHNVVQVGDGVNKRPDPLAVGLRVDGAGRRADGRTPRVADTDIIYGGGGGGGWAMGGREGGREGVVCCVV
jgi:hypothetical protein